MKHIKTVKSDQDSTIKFIFKTFDNLIIEFSYINKNDGKDIICVPSQTMCNLGCKFCHTKEYIGKIKNRNLLSQEIEEGVKYIVADLEFICIDNPLSNKPLLISFMGCGEPLLNIDNIYIAMLFMKEDYEKLGIPLVRFAIATSLPKNSWFKFFELTEAIYDSKLPVKIHLSLHYTNDIIRREWMPAALDILPSIAAVTYYKELTNNAVEIHYALIDGVNDSKQDAILLREFFKNKGINIKFLFYNEKESLNYHASNKDKLKIFKEYFDQYNIPFEYYIPPGLSIGASCGQFLMNYYVENQD